MTARTFRDLLAFAGALPVFAFSCLHQADAASEASERRSRVLVSEQATSRKAPPQKGPARKTSSSPKKAVSQQLIVVTADSWNSHRGSMRRFDAAEGGAWREVGELSAVSLGRKGLAWGRGLLAPTDEHALKKEGDGRSPAGIFQLGTSFGVADTLPDGAQAYPYLQSEATSYCVEDARSENYNRLIDLGEIDSRVWRQRSPLLRKDGLFEWGVVVEHNTQDTVVGAGSCIFLHVWRSEHVGTAGCTAMPLEQAEKMVSWLRPDSGARLVQLPAEIYEALREEQRLPALLESPKPQP